MTGLSAVGSVKTDLLNDLTEGRVKTCLRHSAQSGFHTFRWNEEEERTAVKGSPGWYSGPPNSVLRLAVPTKLFSFQHFTVYKALSLVPLVQAP